FEVAKLSWARPGPTGWWTEGVPGQAFKVTVQCGSGPEGGFVTFLEAGAPSYELRGQDIAGVFVKVVGDAGSARHMSVPADVSALSDSVAMIESWVHAVPKGSAVLLALVGVAPGSLARILAALSPLGVPVQAPTVSCAALAAVGVRPEAGAYQAGSWFSTHASSDVAYATMALQKPF
ncbi:unnamed protein product, partial [Polarella glacialis]